MRTEEEMFQLIMDVAKQEEHIRAVEWWVLARM